MPPQVQQNATSLAPETTEPNESQWTPGSETALDNMDRGDETASLATIPEIVADEDCQNHARRVSSADRMDFDSASAKRRIEIRTSGEPGAEDVLTHKTTIGESSDSLSGVNDVSSEVTQQVQPCAVKDARVKSIDPESLRTKKTDPVEQPHAREPKLAEHIAEAVKNSQRKTFRRGNVAIIIDSEDLGQTWIVSEITARAMSLLKDRISPSTSTTNISRENIHYIFLLEANDEATAMPRLKPLDRETTLQNLAERASRSYLRSSQPKTDVKTEQDVGVIGEDPGIASQINWIEIYEILLYIIVSSDTTRASKLVEKHIDDKLGASAETALAKIEGLIEVAKSNNAMPVLTSALNRIILRYIGKGSLYKAIAADAASWLLIACMIENETIFREAFCHVAGRYPDWPWAKEMAVLPDQVRNAIKLKSRDLDYRRCQINCKLHRITVMAKRLPKDKKAFPVSRRNNFGMYEVVNFYSHWIGEHLEYVEEARAGGRSSDFCDHAGGQCLIKAGLYRAISQGGDAYLAIEDVMAKWIDDDEDKQDYDETEILLTLKEIKSKAKQIVEDLGTSKLQYDGKDQLMYLTCIEVKEEDIPWKNVEEEESEGGCIF